MSASMTFVGIDFGSYSSKVAWYNPDTKKAELLTNAQREWQTPSIVYFGENQTLVGAAAEEKQITGDEETQLRVFEDARQYLEPGAPPVRTLPDDTIIGSEDDGKEVIRALKRIAEEHFQRPVLHAVMTYPISANHMMQERLNKVGQMAGFQEILSLAEPIAIALAYRQNKFEMDERILVYDLGAKACNLTLLEQKTDAPFLRIAGSVSVPRVAGNAFDNALYQHCNEIALEKLKRPISLTGKLDRHFLKKCRLYKEKLSSVERRWFKTELAPDAVPFNHDLKRTEFEEMIRPLLEHTIAEAKKLLEERPRGQQRVWTIILAGGSTNIPLVAQLLEQAFSLQPLQSPERDRAIAIGAAYYAAQTWTPENQYRRLVGKLWEKGELDRADETQLTDLARELHLPASQLAAIEREVMKDTKENILAHQQALTRYRNEVERIWQEESLNQASVAHLKRQAHESGLTPVEAASLERQVMEGDTKETVLARQEALAKYERAIESAASTKLSEQDLEHLRTLVAQLHLTAQQSVAIEYRYMGSTKETFFAYQQALEQYRDEVKRVWRDQPLDRKKVERLSVLAERLPLSPKNIADIERQEMGGMTRKDALAQEEAQEEYRRAIRLLKAEAQLSHQKMHQLYALAEQLHLKEAQIEEIEREILGKLKEELFANQRRRKDI